MFALEPRSSTKFQFLSLDGKKVGHPWSMGIVTVENTKT